MTLLVLLLQQTLVTEKEPVAALPAAAADLAHVRFSTAALHRYRQHQHQSQECQRCCCSWLLYQPLLLQNLALLAAAAAAVGAAAVSNAAA
jgi:hypothetical protein